MYRGLAYSSSASFKNCFDLSGKPFYKTQAGRHSQENNITGNIFG